MASSPDAASGVPHEAGSYLLVLRADRRLDCAIGRLGTRQFRRGWHVYAGSARAGLHARLRHHLAPARPAHWHVDALHDSARLAEVWVALGGERIECALAVALAALPGAERCAGFGSSDCRCPGHLVSFARRPPLAGLWPGLRRLPLAAEPRAPIPLARATTAQRPGTEWLERRDRMATATPPTQPPAPPPDDPCQMCGTPNPPTAEHCSRCGATLAGQPSHSGPPGVLPGSVLVTTGFDFVGYRIVQYLGIVRGITVRSRSIVGGIGASLQQIVGGNITLYTELCEQAREEAYELMVRHAMDMGATAVIGMRYDANEVAPGATEVLAYGTAVVLERAAG